MYGWLVPTDISKSTEYRIKISDVDNPSTFAYSEDFEIYSDKIPGFDVFLLIGLTALIGVLLVVKNNFFVKKLA